MRAVEVVIVTAGFAAGAERATSCSSSRLADIQIRVLEIHPGIDDGHVHIHAVVIHAVDCNLRVVIGKDAPDAGWHILSADVRSRMSSNHIPRRAGRAAALPAGLPAPPPTSPSTRARRQSQPVSRKRWLTPCALQQLDFTVSLNTTIYIMALPSRHCIDAARHREAEQANDQEEGSTDNNR